VASARTGHLHAVLDGIDERRVVVDGEHLVLLRRQFEGEILPNCPRPMTQNFMKGSFRGKLREATSSLGRL
jgi:hypothetical protein